MSIKYGEAGVISRMLKNVDCKKLETASIIVLCALCAILPFKMFVIIILDSWYEFAYVSIQYIVMTAALVVMGIYLGNKAVNIEKGQFVKTVLSTLKSKRFIIYMILFMILMGISVITAIDRDLALFGSLRRSEGFVGRFLYICVFGCAYIIKDSTKKRIVLKTLAISATIICFVTFIQQNPGFTELIGLKNNAVNADLQDRASVFCYFNHYGYYLCMVIVVCAGVMVTAKRKLEFAAYSVMLFINMWSLIINDSFGPLLATIVGIIALPVLLGMNKKGSIIKRVIPIILLIVVCVLFGGTKLLHEFLTFGSDIVNVAENNEYADSAGTGRWTLWKKTAEFIADRPVVGYGEDCITELYTQHGYPQQRPANEFLQYAVFSGIPVMIMYIALLINIFIDRIKNIKKLDEITVIAGAAVVAYLVSSCFGNTMYYSTVYFFMLLGMAACNVKKNV